MPGYEWEPLGKDMVKWINRSREGAAVSALVFFGFSVVEALQPLEERYPGVCQAVADALPGRIRRIQRLTELPSRAQTHMVIGETTVCGGLARPGSPPSLGFLNEFRKGRLAT